MIDNYLLIPIVEINAIKMNRGEAALMKFKGAADAMKLIGYFFAEFATLFDFILPP